jgi:hypothetical protein
MWKTLPLFVALLAPALAAAMPLENKWRLQFSGGAESDGTLELVLTPNGQAPRRIVVAIRAGTGENGVARRVRDALREAAGDSYKAELDDGEDVLVKRRLGRPRFNIALAESSVRGVRINFDQE